MLLHLTARQYRTGAIDDVGTTVSMAIFTMAILVWWVLDNFIFDKLLRYMFTPYLVVVFCLISVLAGKSLYPRVRGSFTYRYGIFEFVIEISTYVCAYSIVFTVARSNHIRLCIYTYVYVYIYKY